MNKYKSRVDFEVVKNDAYRIQLLIFRKEWGVSKDNGNVVFWDIRYEQDVNGDIKTSVERLEALFPF